MKVLLPVFLAILALVCTMVHGVKDPAAREAAEAMHKSINAMSSTTSRALKSMNAFHKGLSKSSTQRNGMSRHILSQMEEEGFCTWKNGKCRLSNRVALLVLEDAGSEIAEIGRQHFKCVAQQSKKKCKAAGGCVWDAGVCNSSHGGFSDAGMEKCLGDVAPFARIGRQGDICEEQPSPAACGTIDGCSWDTEESECGADIWNTLIGVPTVDGKPFGMEQALEALQQSLMSSLSITLILSEDPSVFLDLEAPDFECPAGIDARVCDFVRPAGELMGISLYCSKKYSEGGAQCDADPHCQAELGSCNAAQEAQAKVLEKQMKAIIGSIPDPTVRRIVGPVLSCARKSKDGCEETCAWNEEDQECSLNNVWLGTQMANEAKKSPDPLCNFFAATMQTGCMNLEKSACSLNELCEWEAADDECGVKNDVMTSLALKIDPELASAQPLWEECATATKKKACLSL